jgi:type IV secretory pathway protease TraF
MKRIPFGAFAIAFVCILSLCVELPHLFYINTSPSAPFGIYCISSSSPAAGDYCLVQKQDIPLPLQELPQVLLKRIECCHSEYVRINDDGVFVDGRYICNRPIKKRIAKYFYSGRLPDRQCLLINDHPDSFDSRHFGPVETAHLQKVDLLIKL